MNSLPQIEPKSTDGILNCLALAIDEAKLMRSIAGSKAMVEQLKIASPRSNRLAFLNRQIADMEDQLAKTRKQAKVT